MAAAQKKVVIRLRRGGVTWGYLPACGFVTQGVVEFLDPGGRTMSLTLDEIAWIAFVRDFNLDDAVDPERIGRRSYAARPRGEGLWLRLEFLDGEMLEGLAHVGLGLLDGLAEDGGLTMDVPDPRSNTLRVFVPRSALRSVAALGYVGLAKKSGSAERKAEPVPEQPGLFEG